MSGKLKLTNELHRKSEILEIRRSMQLYRIIMGRPADDVAEDPMNTLLLDWSRDDLPSHLHDHLSIKPDQRLIY